MWRLAERAWVLAGGKALCVGEGAGYRELEGEKEEVAVKDLKGKGKHEELTPEELDEDEAPLASAVVVERPPRRDSSFDERLARLHVAIGCGAV